MYFCIENFAKLATANQNFYLTDSRLNFRLIQLISISKTEVAEEKIIRAISHSSYELMLEIVPGGNLDLAKSETAGPFSQRTM